MCWFQAKVLDSVRISKLRLFAEYLCGIDPPLMSYDVERSCYISAVTPWSAATDNDRDQRDVSKRLDSETKVWSVALYWDCIFDSLLFDRI